MIDWLNQFSNRSLLTLLMKKITLYGPMRDLETIKSSISSAFILVKPNREEIDYIKKNKDKGVYLYSFEQINNVDINLIL